MIRQRRLLDIENTRMQMSMMAFSTLDTFDDKQRIAAQEPKTESVEQCYLGLLMQSFVGPYELDIYGFISLANVKFLIFKTEAKLNPVKVNASERYIR